MSVTELDKLLSRVGPSLHLRSCCPFYA